MAVKHENIPAEKPPVKKRRPAKKVISLGLSPDVLERVDAWAEKHGMSRAAAISFAITKLE